MKITQIRHKKIKGVAELIDYQYENIEINVNKDISGYVEIRAHNKNKDIELIALNNSPATITVNMLLLKTKDEIELISNELIKMSKLLDLVNNKRNILLKGINELCIH